MTELALQGRSVLVTGAAAGIGRAIVRAIAARGGRVVLFDRDEAGAVALAQAIGADSALACGGEVTDSGAVEAALDAVTARWGGLDGLVNNAGFGDTDAILDTDDAAWQRVIDVNLTAPFRLGRQAVRRMTEGGAIVNVASIYGVVAAPNRAGYCVTKAGLVMLTKVQALEWAGLGIRVNAVAPGYIATEPVAELARQGKIELAAIERRTPLGRMGTADEVAAAVCFLLDPVAASYVTGHVLGVDGGWVAYGYV